MRRTLLAAGQWRQLSSAHRDFFALANSKTSLRRFFRGLLQAAERCRRRESRASFRKNRLQMTFPDPGSTEARQEDPGQGSLTEEPSSRSRRRRQPSKAGGKCGRKPNVSDETSVGASLLLSFRGICPVFYPCTSDAQIETRKRHHDSGAEHQICARKHSGKHRLDNCARLCGRSVDALELA